nr:RNA dependent RNA polymerase [Cladosporium ramotenellum polymycovirus 1]WEW73476.1 RNA dependent RNA polymerase [Cladosporium ramotenellum polymycovirus 1]
MTSTAAVSYGTPLVVSLDPSPRLTSGQATAQITKALSSLVVNTLSVGIIATSHSFSVQNLVSGALETHSVDGISAGAPPFIATPTARAKAFRVPDRADGDIIAALRNYDQPKPLGGKSKTQFWRSADRLKAAVAEANKLSNPSLSVCQYQTPKAFSFGGGPPADERPLKVPVLGAIDEAAKHLGATYGRTMHESVQLADYTSHDPETLHPRFLNYVNERITEVDRDTALVMEGAKTAQRGIWRDAGVEANARPLSDAAPPILSTLINRGSAGEYRSLGVTDRRDPRLVDLMSRSLSRYATVGKMISAGKRAPKWLETTQQPTLSFGKDEPKAAKRRKDGTIEPPIPRFIFNLSPINYALAVFLHGDLSHELQEKDVTYGPGFGPGRGRSSKFLDVVENAFKGGFKLHPDEPMVMSDIWKWDSFIREVLLELGIDNIEMAVNRADLDSPALAARAAMMGVSKRQLMHKLVEHPSGYLVDLYGAMPSGSYYTSLLNTNANNLLLMGHLIDRAAKETSYTVAGAAEVVRAIAPGLMVSYGDNQLFSARMFTRFGLKYDPNLHAEFLSRFGMKLKVDETEIATNISRVRFCSRAVVRTPEGLLVTRTHTALYQKLAARPEHDPITDKLYVRAIMADYMGTDPVAYEAFSQVDRQLDVALDISVVTPKIKKILAPTARSFYGAEDDQALLNVLASLRAGQIDRRALLSLHTPHAQATKKKMKLGTSTTIGGTLFGGPLTPAAAWAHDQTRSTWAKYLKETDQSGVLFD